MKPTLAFKFLMGVLLLFSLAALPAQRMDSYSPPDHIVKLIFIHHSTGENWLTDGYSGLVRDLSLLYALELYGDGASPVVHVWWVR